MKIIEKRKRSKIVLKILEQAFKLVISLRVIDHWLTKHKFGS